MLPTLHGLNLPNGALKKPLDCGNYRTEAVHVSEIVYCCWSRGLVEKNRVVFSFLFRLLSPTPPQKICIYFHLFVFFISTSPSAAMALSLQSTYKLVSGYEIPVVGFGVSISHPMENSI